MTGPSILFARSRGAAVFFSGLGLSALLVILVPAEPVEVPLRTGVSTVIYPIAVALPALFWGLALSRPSGGLEDMHGRRLRAPRARWLAFVIASTAVVMLGTSPVLSAEAVAIVARNLALLGAVTITAAVAVSPLYSWVPGFTYVGASIVFGVGVAWFDVRWWALLLKPAVLWHLVAGALWLAAASAAYVHRDVHVDA